ncbi:zinc finger, GRF-type containing protein [Tanacetum coccineum]
MVRCACGLEAVIKTSWTNRNPGRRFYGCPTLSPTCVNFLRWYDPPMCQRSVQIIPGLLRSRNELEEITQREAQQANELSNLTRQRQLLASVNYRRAIIQELERLSGNLVSPVREETQVYSEGRTSLDPSWSKLEFHLSGDEFLSSLQGGNGGACKLLRWLLGDEIEVLEEVDINKKTENQAKMTKLSMEWKRLCKIKAKVQKAKSESIQENQQFKPSGTEEYY